MSEVRFVIEGQEPRTRSARLETRGDGSKLTLLINDKPMLELIPVTPYSRTLGHEGELMIDTYPMNLLKEGILTLSACGVCGPVWVADMGKG